MKKMEMRIGAIGIDEKSGDPIVVLKDTENTRVLPIWIGLPEARAITLAANKVVSPRPLTHDLLYSTIEQLGYKVKEVVIDKIESHTFIATIYLHSPGSDGASALAIDARPSDAIALALKAEAPLMVAENIVAEAGVSVVQAAPKDEEFSEFVSSVKASDFKVAGKVELPPDEEE
jgi:bifunctional DNase/RNase